MDSRAAAYLRRSSVSEQSPGDVSREAQLVAVRALAQANGIDPDALTIYEDWGRSADETKREKRTGYLALMRAIEDRALDFVFVYHIDRIIRSVRDFAELQQVADGHTTILTPQFPLTGTDPMARAFAQVAAVFAELELNRIKQRNRKALDVRIARGDALGHPTWGMAHVRNGDDQMVEVPDPDKADDVAKVIGAVREAGTILGAVKLLNERGVPAPKGGDWHTSALTRIVKAHAPELVERKRRGGRPAGPSILRGLIRCHCGTMMTPNAARRQLYCYNGNRQGVDKHGRAHVRERDLLPWIMDRAQQTHDQGDAAIRRQNAEARRADLIEQRERLGYAVVDGLLTRDQARSKAGEIDDELAQLAEDLDALGEARPAPLLTDASGEQYDPTRPQGWLDFDTVRWDTGIVVAMNEHFRSLWRHIQLDKQMRPVGAEWR